MKMRGARILLEALRCENVKHIFGYPGGAVLHIYDELAKHEAALGINHYNLCACFKYFGAKWHGAARVSKR